MLLPRLEYPQSNNQLKLPSQSPNKFTRVRLRVIWSFRSYENHQSFQTATKLGNLSKK